jgi:gamma-glutamyl phosphate reductase
MKKTTILAGAVILVLGIGLMLGLSKYKLPLIHSIVQNAVVQKAPPNYPQARIRQAFEQNLQKARQMDREDVYLDRLLKASQRLEKIQSLDSKQVDELLMELDPAQPGTPRKE